MLETKKVCYYCGEIATSDEHIPPKQLFPNGKYDRITVRSCSLHNTCKGSLDDRVIKYLVSILIDKTKLQKVSPHLMEIIEKNFKHIREHRKFYHESVVHYPGSFDRSVKFRSMVGSEGDLSGWVAQMAVGLLSFVNKGYEPGFNYSKIGVGSNSFDSNPTGVYTSEEYFQRKRMVIGMENHYREIDWLNGVLKGPRQYSPEVFSWKLHVSNGYLVVWLEVLTYFIWWVMIPADQPVVNKYKNYLVNR